MKKYKYIFEVEYINFYLIILKMFDSVLIFDNIQRKGYLYFISLINVDIVRLIIDKLNESYAINKIIKLLYLEDGYVNLKLIYYLIYL